MTKDELKQQHPELYNEIFEDGRKAGLAGLAQEGPMTAEGSLMVRAAKDWSDRN